MINSSNAVGESVIRIVIAIFSISGVASAQSAIPLERTIISANAHLTQLVQAAVESVPDPSARTPASAMAERASAMQVLIRRAPDRAISLALPPATLARLGFLFPGSASHLEQRSIWSGTVSEWIEDHSDRKSTRHVVLLRSGDTDFELHFGKNAAQCLKSGDRVTVSGLRFGTDIAVASAAATPGTVITSACSSVGEQRIAVLLAGFPGVPRPNITAEELRQVFFGPSGRSLDGYWREASYGKTWATGDVFDWFDLDRAYGCNEIGKLRDAALAVLAMQTDLSKYNRFFIYFPASCGSILGFGQLGCSNGFSSVMLPIKESISPDMHLQVAAHEGGHNLGLNEAAARTYALEVLGSPDRVGLRSVYDDPFTTMGNFSGIVGHYNAREKLQMGWLTSPEVIVVQQPGSHSLIPLGSQHSGVKALKIRRPGTGGWLWAEYREASDIYEATLPWEAAHGALIYYEDGRNRDTAALPGMTDLLDFTPGSAAESRDDLTDAALPSGRHWADLWSPISLAVTAEGGSRLTIRVNDDSCVSSTDTSSLIHGAGAEDGSISVSAPAECEWEVDISEPWITLTSPNRGSGDGVITYRTTESDVLPRRTATIAVGRKSLRIEQQGLNKPPTGTRLHPASGSGYSELFTLVYSDPNGAEDVVAASAEIQGQTRYCSLTLLGGNRTHSTSRRVQRRTSSGILRGFGWFSKRSRHSGVCGGPECVLVLAGGQ